MVVVGHRCARGSLSSKPSDYRAIEGMTQLGPDKCFGEFGALRLVTQ